MLCFYSFVVCYLCVSRFILLLLLLQLVVYDLCGCGTSCASLLASINVCVALPVPVALKAIPTPVKDFLVLTYRRAKTVCNIQYVLFLHVSSL